MVNAYPQAIVHDPEHVEQNIDVVPTTPYVKDFSKERKEALLKLLPADAQILKFHQSLCPGCVDEEKWDMMKIDAVTYVRNNKVWITKSCAEHGQTKELYWSDYEMFKKAERFQDPGIKILNPHIDKSKFDIDCPSDCGLCVEHESHTGLGNVVITNRCDLTCWYCFFYAKEGEPIYEPSMDQIKFMLKRMRNIKPVGANAVQITGGEPTLREDLPEIIRAAKDIGYDHVQLNTNGVNLAHEPALAVRIRDAGVNNLYMSFDGMTPETNPKNYWEAQTAIESCRQAGMGVVLVPTVIGGVNDHELGDIIRFGAGNIDTVRSVNFQPVSLVGRMPDQLRKRQRITIPGAIKRIEEQTDGQIGREDFFPVPCAKQVTDFVEALKDEPKYRLSIHFACGMATYVFKEGSSENMKLIPITRFFDVDGFFDYLGGLTKEINNAKHKKMRKSWVLAKLMWNIRKFVDEEHKPKDLKFVRMLTGAMQGGNYHGLADFHKNSLFIGMMHFQDPFNWDIDRIHKCDIHYATPDGRVIPFCTFNVIPELYRDRIQRKFSIPFSEWEKKTGKQLSKDKYHRSLTREQMMAIKTNYDQHRKFKTRQYFEADWGDEEISKVVEPLITGPMLAGAGKSGVSHFPKRPTMSHPASGGALAGDCCSTDDIKSAAAAELSKRKEQSSLNIIQDGKESHECGCGSGDGNSHGSCGC